MNRQRLEAEALRDTLLADSDTLDSADGRPGDSRARQPRAARST